MKVAVSSYGKDLNSQIDPRFGRCAYFLIVDTDDMSFEAFENKGVSLSSGAGIQVAQFVISKGAKVVLTGNCGPKAIQTLSAAGIKLFTGHTESVIKALEKYKSSDLTSTINVEQDVSNIAANSGREMGGSGGGRGIGGGGRGMGGGGGRGMGGGGSGMGGGGGRGMGGGGSGMGGSNRDFGR